MNTSVHPPLHSPPSADTFQWHDTDWHESSIARALDHWDGRSDLWVFGYGSLIWRPEFDFLESRMACLQGYHRALCLWSRVNRGTPEVPGLVFALDEGGACEGKAFRIAGAQVRDIMRALWYREMPSASYIPCWLDCETPQGPVNALAFAMDRHHDGYIPNLPLEQTLSIVRQGHGRYGPCTDYVLQTADALEAAGIADPSLQTLAQALRSNPAPCP